MFRFSSDLHLRMNFITLNISWHSPTEIKTLGTTDFSLANLGSPEKANFSVIIRISNFTPSKTVWTDKDPIKRGSTNLEKIHSLSNAL